MIWLEAFRPLLPDLLYGEHEAFSKQLTGIAKTNAVATV